MGRQCTSSRRGRLIGLAILALGFAGIVEMPAQSQEGAGRIAAATRSQADEKPDAFLQRAYPGSRTRNDPRFSTGSGVYRGYFVSLPDGRTLWVGLETQFSTLPGRSTPSAFLELSEKLLQSPQSWKVSAGGVGPIQIGMTPAAVKEACALNPVLTGGVVLTPSGGTARALSISYFGKRWLVAEVLVDTITRIEVLEPKLKLEAGIGAGSPVSELADQFGPGEVFVEGSGLLLTFPSRCPGHGFRVTPPAGVPPTWSSVLKANPRVRSLVLAGTPGAFAAETRPTGFPRADRSRSGEAPDSFMKRAFPGVKVSLEAGRDRPEASLTYLVQTADGKIHRAALRPLSATQTSRRDAGPFALTTRELRTPFKWQMSSGALGPIRLGMKRSQLETACDPYAVSLLPLRKREAGDAGSVVAVNHLGIRLAEIHLDNRQSTTGIQVLDPRWKTPQKAGVGSPFKELVRVYGNGELIIGDSEIWVVFERTCPGRSFLLSHPVPEDDGKPLWPVLVKTNPKVKAVRVEAR